MSKPALNRLLETNERVAALREDAKEDKMEADYKVALQKCDSMSGAAKDSCVADAKAKYHK